MTSENIEEKYNIENTVKITNKIARIPKLTKPIKKQKVPENLLIPEYNNYDIITKYNYTIKQLKDICKEYKLSKIGNKEELIIKIGNYLKLSFYAIKIQRSYKIHLAHRLNKYKGPAIFNRKLCTNENDFYSFDEIKTLNYSQFFSFKDSDNFIYGFDILSLYNLILKNGKTSSNPYNRNILSKTILLNIRNVIKLSNILKIPINIQLEKLIVAPEKKEHLRLVSLCQKMDELGNYTDVKWFTLLNRDEIIKFLYELNDIWQYRAQLTNDIKINICPPSGDPFRNTNLNHIKHLDIKKLKVYYLNIIDNLINLSPHREYNVLGAYYVLSALTLVSSMAANALPWLYDSVAHI